MTIKGLDVSSYNGIINWPAVAKAGYSFAFIKAVEGQTLRDPTFVANVKGARAAGLLVGAYGFARPATSSPTAEADALLKRLDEVGGVDFPPMLDMEDAGGMQATQLQSFVRLWMARIKQQTGKQAILYTSPAFATAYLSGLGSIPLWIAHYGVENPTVPRGWSKWTFWQYTKTGSVPGINGAVDLDYFNGTLQDLKTFLGGNSVTYSKVAAKLNGTTIDAVAVDNSTYLIWTAARLTGANLTKVAYGDVEIDGKKVPQIVQGGNTYLLWSSIPTIDPKPVKDSSGVWEFKTLVKTPPAPVQHNYSLVITEDESAVAGTWSTIAIQTFDNGQPLGNQQVYIYENDATVPNSVITDPTTGGYGWGIQETTNATDTMVFKWTDPAGVLHTVSKTTTFIVPQTTDAPVPSDDNVVVRIPILPDSDASDAVFFNMTAPNGQTIECQLDTGAFELMFTTDAAKTLGLANEGNLTVQGVGGTASAYYSSAAFSLNGVSFTDVPCVVEDAFQGYPLFGYRFFVDNGYDLLVSQKHNQIVIMKA